MLIIRCPPCLFMIQRSSAVVPQPVGTATRKPVNNSTYTGTARPPPTPPYSPAQQVAPTKYLSGQQPPTASS